MQLENPIVNNAWLQEHLDDDASRDSLRIFDASYFLSDKTRDPRQEYKDEHIPGAQFFDITTIADTTSKFSNTVPTTSFFEQAVGELGVSNQHTVIVYDRLGMFSAARVWWLFRYFGHENVAVLDGGLPKWLADDGKVESSDVAFDQATFTAKQNPGLFRSSQDVLQASNTGSEQIVDVRAANRFAGLAPEPKAGLRSGRIPNSMNLPYDTLLNDDKTFKSRSDIKNLFEKAGIDLSKPMVTSCGSGVTACIVSLALQYSEGKNSGMFDGSWTEWGSTETLPIETD